MRAILSALLISIAGCASSPGALKADPSARREAKIQAPYQLAFKRITEGLRECAPPQILPIGQAINDAKLYPDLQLATITLGASGFGTQIHHHMEIAAAGKDASTLVLFAAARPDANLARYAKWAMGDFTC